MAFAGYLKQSTAATIVLGPFVDATDGDTAETALTISQADVRLSKNAGAFAQVNESTSATHMEAGLYSKLLNTTDTNTLGNLTVAVKETGALRIKQDYAVVPANVYDSLFSTDLLQVDLTQIAGAAVSTSTAQLGVNVVSSGAAAGVTSLKKGVAVTKVPIYLELTAGGPATGKTVTVQISKDGGAFATIADTVTEISAGWYEFDLSGTEMNADWIAVKATATTTNQRNFVIRTQV